MKLLIIGYARHGKDSFAEVLNEIFEFSYKSSSWAAAEIFIFDILKDLLSYESIDECYDDRHEHRALWYNLICAYNYHNPIKLANRILEDNDCYVGMRSRKEINESVDKELFDLIVWIDASERIGNESSKSCDIIPEDADIIITNNGSINDLRRKAIKFGKTIGLKIRQ